MSNDQDVVTRFLAGDRLAVETVDGWISRAAWPFQRRLSSRFEDVLQDVRLEVTRLLGEGKFRGESSLRTYLWRVVNHTCLDQLRSQNRWQWTDLESLEMEGAPAAPPPSAALGHEEKDLLVKVLDRVSGECRELWRLILAGFSYREMSLRQQVAEGTLRVRVLRCRERAIALREELLGSLPGPPRNVRPQRTPKRGGGMNANDL